MAAPSYGAYNETNNGRPHSVGINGYNTAAPMSFGTQANPWQEYFGGFDMPLPVLMFTLLNFSFRSPGQPVGELKLNPYDAFARENLALPDAYKGSSPYMTSIIINSAYNNSYCTLRRSADAMHFFHLSVVQDADMWPAKIALPYRFTESEMEIVWCVHHDALF
jgi:hypothetical protein